MKKIFFTVLTLFLMSMPVFSAEKMSVRVAPKSTYVLILNKAADVVMPSDKTFVEANVLTTVFNEKNQIIIKTFKEGMAKLYIAMGKEILIIELDSQAEYLFDEEEVKCTKSVEDFVKIDLPFSKQPKRQKQQQQIKIDEPPVYGGRSYD